MTRRVIAAAAVVVAVLPLGCGGSDRSAFDGAARQRFDAAWTGLLERLERHHPEVDLGLRPGATDDAISSLEAVIGRELPEEVRELYRRADGQEGQVFDLFPSYRFMPLEEIAGHVEIMRHPMMRVLSLLPLGDNDPKIRNRLYHPGWIPIGENGAGDMLCVDTAPAAGGDHGQLVEYIHDDTWRKRIAPSLTALFERLERGLESGDVVPYLEWRTFLKKEDVPEDGPGAS